ncbi:hypothetical protein CsSME_00039997 [Camellia sinensis var. sinensis]
MEHLIPFVITNLSATELKHGRLFGKIKVYATVSISGGPPTHNTEFTTHVDMEGNNNPKWNTVMDFRLHDPSLQNNLLYLNFNFHCRQNLGYKFISGVSVLINLLLAMISGNRTASQAVQYLVMMSSGELRGFVNFCFRFGNSIRPLGPQQPALRWQPPPPPHGSNAQANDDQANQFDDDDHANL